MCWSPVASLALGSAGLGVAAYGYQEKAPKHFTLPLAYFSLIEFIQYFSYASVGQCALSGNTLLTTVSYIHVAFQPVFINMFLMGGVRVTERMRRISYAISFAVTAILLAKLVPFYPESLCTPGQTLCGPQMCTVAGNWHLAWQMPYYDFPIPGDIFFYYALAVFVVPLFYRAWIGVVVLFLSGPALTYMLTKGNPNEWPAVWCSFATGLILLSGTSYAKRVMKGVHEHLGPNPVRVRKPRANKPFAKPRPDEQS